MPYAPKWEQQERELERERERNDLDVRKEVSENKDIE
jgi:hypothetical protein